MYEEMVKRGFFSLFSFLPTILLMNIDSNIILARIACGITFPVVKRNDQET